jgi:hypothetical protein
MCGHNEQKITSNTNFPNHHISHGTFVPFFKGTFTRLNYSYTGNIVLTCPANNEVQNNKTTCENANEDISHSYKLSSKEE